jgi:hypothetical protein
MSKTRFCHLALLAFALSTIAIAGDDRHWGHNLNTSTTNADSYDCQDHIHISSSDLPVTAHNEESITLPNTALTVTASQNGGIHVRNWDKNEISVKLCRAAAARTEGDAQRVLGEVHLNNSAGRISVEGPDSAYRDDVAWSSVLLILAPKGATMELSAHNGGISLKSFDGNVTGHAINGGISLSQTTGKINVEAQNGGISIKDCGGDVKATVQNGGLSIQLGENWNGSGLEARTHNGGLVVEIPRDFHSSLEVSTGEHASLICQSDVCANGERTWDDNGRIFRIGSNPIIHASTVNGGTVIKERGSSRGRGDI